MQGQCCAGCVWFRRVRYPAMMASGPPRGDSLSDTPYTASRQQLCTPTETVVLYTCILAYHAVSTPCAPPYGSQQSIPIIVQLAARLADSPACNAWSTCHVLVRLRVLTDPQRLSSSVTVVGAGKGAADSGGRTRSQTAQEPLLIKAEHH